MARTKWTELRESRLARSSEVERAEYDRAHRAAMLAAAIGKQIRGFGKRHR
jgi:hypothetical protein